MNTSQRKQHHKTLEESHGGRTGENRRAGWETNVAKEWDWISISKPDPKYNSRNNFTTVPRSELNPPYPAIRCTVLSQFQQPFHLEILTIPLLSRHHDDATGRWKENQAGRTQKNQANSCNPHTSLARSGKPSVSRQEALLHPASQAVNRHRNQETSSPYLLDRIHSPDIPSPSIPLHHHSPIHIHTYI